MFRVTLLLSLTLAAAANPARITEERSTFTSPSVVDATWDGKCFYPKPDSRFQLDTYLGKWYQVAATETFFNKGCSCDSAEYTLNANGTVGVLNKSVCKGTASQIAGYATPAPAHYGEKGVLKVVFPGMPDFATCPGPNYIVQVYESDWAIVQASKFETLFILSRKQYIPETDLDAWLRKAELKGSDLAKVKRTTQIGCPT